MNTQHYEVLYKSGLRLRIAYPGDSLEKTPLQIEQLAFDVATDQIVTKGGTGGSSVKFLMPTGLEIPKNAITNEKFPGVFIWFP